ncbi:hypothetical protein [Haloarcula marina]|uniref:hypothetical protein n=1 Tax=Haloarcula marina TaxID=2961574 RepID=UPI0020B7BBDB|nr:hypothetical protein [Halomicroarcula marina]
MPPSHMQVVTSDPERSGVPARMERFEVTLLEYQIAALEQELDRERQRRQAVVDRYEQLLAEQ